MFLLIGMVFMIKRCLMRSYLKSDCLCHYFQIVSWSRLELMYIYTPHGKIIRWSLIRVHGFQLFISAHRNWLFFTNGANLLRFTSNWYRLLVAAKGLLKLQNLLILMKQSITSQKLSSCKFWWTIVIVFELLIVFILWCPKVLSYRSGDSGIFLPACLSRTNLKLHNIFVTAEMAKNVITDLISLGHLGMLVFHLWFWRTVSLSFYKI